MKGWQFHKVTGTFIQNHPNIFPNDFNKEMSIDLENKITTTTTITTTVIRFKYFFTIDLLKFILSLETQQYAKS